LACYHWARTVYEMAQRGHLQFRQNQKDAEGEGKNGSQLHECAEIIAWGKQKPNRQDAGGQTIADDGPGQVDFFQPEPPREFGALVNNLSAPYRQQETNDPEHGSFHDFANAPEPQIP